jgi:hypothetical protein
MAEVSAVTKQTTETLMAGEKIIEALDIADEDRAATQEYTEALDTANQSLIPPQPKRHAILAALDVTPEEYVLQVVERISGAELFDALLVLPFGKVVSLIGYLDAWAARVSSAIIMCETLTKPLISTGMEYAINIKDPLLPPQDAPSSSSHQSHPSRRPHSST